MSDAILLELLRHATIDLVADDDDGYVSITFEGGNVTFNLQRDDDPCYGGRFTIDIALLDGLLYAATKTRRGSANGDTHP